MDNNFSQFSPLPQKHRSPIVAIIVTIVAICVVAGGTIFVASLMKKGSSSSSNTPVAISAADTIAKYTAGGAITAYTSDYQKSSLANQPVYYQSAQKSYGVEVQAPAKNNATYAITSGKTDASQAIASQTSALLTSLGFKQENMLASSPTMTNRTTYVNGGTICQYSAPQSVHQYGGTYSLTCVDTSLVTQEYAAVGSLVSIYEAANKSNTAPQYTQINRSELVTDGNKSLAVVEFYQGKTASMQLFAAINGKWEFIVTLDTPGDTSSNGKYSDSPAVEKALQNPAYGNFLVDNVG